MKRLKKLLLMVFLLPLFPLIGILDGDNEDGDNFEDDIEDNSSSEKTFSQAEVNDIVKKRVGREQATHNELVTALKTMGFSGTTAEIAKQVKEYYTSLGVEGSVKEINAVASQLKDEDKEALEFSKEQLKTKKQKEAEEKAFNAQVKEFNTAYPDVSLDELNDDKDFIEFSSDLNCSLTVAYKKYISFKAKIDKTSDEKASEKYLKANRSTSGGSSTTQGKDFGLTASQKQIVDEFNNNNPHMKMTYEEYSKQLK